MVVFYILLYFIIGYVLYSEKELQNLLEDENALLNIVKDFPEIIALEENKRSLYAKNEEIASNYFLH